MFLFGAVMARASVPVARQPGSVSVLARDPQVGGSFCPSSFGLGLCDDQHDQNSNGLVALGGVLFCTIRCKQPCRRDPGVKHKALLEKQLCVFVCLELCCVPLGRVKHQVISDSSLVCNFGKRSFGPSGMLCRLLDVCLGLFS